MIRFLIPAMLLFGAGICRAQTVPTAPLQVTASVDPVCDIGGAPDGNLPSGQGDFGRHSALGVEFDRDIILTMIVDLSIRCTKGVTPTIAFDYGQNANGSQRRMRGPHSALIPYELRRGLATAPLWDDRPWPVTIAAGQEQRLPVYGTVTSLQPNLPDGIYTDQVQVTLSY